MKKISFMIAALLVAMTGCQKEPQVNPENNPGSNAEAVGYVSLKISLPSSTGTKADPTGGFDDGLKKEYNVKDVTVVFYDEDGKYIFHTGVNTKPWNTNGENNDNITVTGKTEAIMIEENADKVKQALVLVNTANIISQPDLTNYLTSDFNSLATASVLDIPYALRGSSTDEFFMSNAPYYDGNVFRTLVDVTVKDNELSALASAASVKVERAAAKVSVRAGYGGNATSWIIGDNEFEATFDGWGLSVTNFNFYLVRNGYDKTNTTWFNNTNPINDGLLGSRIYMAVDPNYTGTDLNTPSDFYLLQYDDQINYMDGDVAYCTENTFCVESMKENQTTTVIAKMAMYPKGSVSSDRTWFQVGTSKSVYTIQNFAKYIVEKVKEVDDVTVDESSILALEYRAGDCSELAVPGTSKTLADYVGAVNCFDNGYCYYPVKIRHFNDSELGYVNDTDFQDSYTNNGGYVPSDLGRYGVLRNTYYNISINSVSGPGSSTIPTPGTVDDDKFEQFVACTIDILAWSVRNHGVDL